MFYLLWLQPVRLEIKEQVTVSVSIIKSHYRDLINPQIIWPSYTCISKLIAIWLWSKNARHASPLYKDTILTIFIKITYTETPLVYCSLQETQSDVRQKTKITAFYFGLRV